MNLAPNGSRHVVYVLHNIYMLHNQVSPSLLNHHLYVRTITLYYAMTSFLLVSSSLNIVTINIMAMYSLKLVEYNMCNLCKRCWFELHLGQW